MREDIAERLRYCAEGPNADLSFEAADEIERVRSNLTEALRLMEPMVDGSCSVDFVYHEHFEAIADFVTRMRGK